MSYTDLLNKKPTEVERPKPLPIGTYIFKIDGPASDVKEVGEKKTPMFDFPCVVLEPHEVDEEDVEAFGRDVVGAKTRISFALTEAALYRLSTFLSEHLGLDGDMSLKELIAEANGQRFAGIIEHRPGRDGDDSMYANIKSTMSVDDLED